ncbi:MAG: hypothetical protein AB7C98_10650 [Acidithiobacillus sp.]
MDWKTLILDLQAAGWTQAKIAEAMGGKAQSWVADIVRERYDDLKWTDGQRLIKIHRREMRKHQQHEAAHA